MSTFFKALERAEQERALRGRTPTTDPAGVPGPAAPAPETVFTRPPQSPSRPLRSAVPEKERAAELRDPAHEIEDHLVSLLEPNSFAAEQYRVLRHMIDQHRRSGELAVIAVSSPDVAEGKTTTAINLAGALAQAPDARVLLIDADLRARSLAVHLGLDDHTIPGLVDAIMNTDLTLEAVTQRYSHFNMSVITAGRHPAAPYEVLKSPRVGELLTEARRRYDYVIVDTPPLVTVPDARVTGKWVDGFLIVVAAHRTPRKLLEETLNLLEPTKIVGMVFNGDDRHVSMDSYTSQRRSISRRALRKGQTASDE